MGILYECEWQSSGGCVSEKDLKISERGGVLYKDVFREFVFFRVKQEFLDVFCVWVCVRECVSVCVHVCVCARMPVCVCAEIQQAPRRGILCLHYRPWEWVYRVDTTSSLRDKVNLSTRGVFFFLLFSLGQRSRANTPPQTSETRSPNNNYLVNLTHTLRVVWLVLSGKSWYKQKQTYEVSDVFSLFPISCLLLQFLFFLYFLYLYESLFLLYSLSVKLPFGDSIIMFQDWIIFYLDCIIIFQDCGIIFYDCLIIFHFVPRMRPEKLLCCVSVRSPVSHNPHALSFLWEKKVLACFLIFPQDDYETFKCISGFSSKSRVTKIDFMF